MSREEARLGVTEIITQGIRGWKNLNKVAGLCISQNATSEDRTLSINAAARMLQMDPSQLSRLIDNKAGFVRCYKRSESGVRATGFYYMLDPMLRVARAENPEHNYPKNLMPVADQMPRYGLTKMVIVDDDKPRGNGITEDPLIKQLMVQAGIQSEAVIAIPVTKDATIAANEYDTMMAHITNLMGGKFRGVRVDIGKYSDEDLAELEARTARIAWKAAVDYYTVKQLRERRELK